MVLGTRCTNFSSLNADEVPMYVYSFSRSYPVHRSIWSQRWVIDTSCMQRVFRPAPKAREKRTDDSKGQRGGRGMEAREREREQQEAG
eukprot:1080306-Pyramimonas_sp.AAC.1